ncbi:hypothetical protein BC826DRAFT_116628 [Russula brevipes]|nr:hypothetical protein BC826DRAFT_116628 [Russula brevipes]
MIRLLFKLLAVFFGRRMQYIDFKCVYLSLIGVPHTPSLPALDGRAIAFHSLASPHVAMRFTPLLPASSRRCVFPPRFPLPHAAVCFPPFPLPLTTACSRRSRCLTPLRVPAVPPACSRRCVFPAVLASDIVGDDQHDHSHIAPAWIR